MAKSIRISAQKIGSGAMPVAIPSDPTEDNIRKAIHELAQQHYSMARSDTQTAVDSLMSLMSSRPDVEELFRPILLRRGLYDEVRLCSRHERRRVYRDLKDNGEWTAPVGLGEGLSAKKRNLAVLWDYQFPFIAKKLAETTFEDMQTAVQMLKTRHEHDTQKISLGTAILRQRGKAKKDARLTEQIGDEKMAKLLRMYGGDT